MIVSCEKLMRRLASGEFDHAGLLRRAQLGLHYLFCAACARMAAQFRALGEWARRDCRARLPEARAAALTERLLQKLGRG